MRCWVDEKQEEGRTQGRRVSRGSNDASGGIAGVYLGSEIQKSSLSLSLTFVGAVADDGPGLARPRLAVGEERRVVAVPGVGQHAAAKVVVHGALEVG